MAATLVTLSGPIMVYRMVKCGPGPKVRRFRPATGEEIAVGLMTWIWWGIEPTWEDHRLIAMR